MTFSGEDTEEDTLLSSKEHWEGEGVDRICIWKETVENILVKQLNRGSIKSN